MKNIVVITDCTDIAFNEVYAVLELLLTKNNVKDFKIHPLVPVKNFSIINASFAIRLMADLYGENTYFLVIVSATKDLSERVFGETKHGITFVGNNSGYFGWMLEDFGCEYAYKNKQTKDIEYKSFGGKFVQAPTIVDLLIGKDKSSFGEKIPNDDLHSIRIQDGTVVHCDNFGLMKIKSLNNHGLDELDQVQILINENPTLKATFSKSMKKHEDGAWILYQGSSINGLLELGKVRNTNSAQEINVREGDMIKWIKI
jgi:S-adenosylmethionine hydrolase